MPYDSAYPVDTYWDIGVGDNCTIWFVQRKPTGFHYIDYYENNGKGVDHYATIIRERRYKYGRHVWPHDGEQREFGTGITRREMARKHGLNVEIQKRQKVDDRIQASRSRISISFFDETKCKRGLDALFNYQTEWDGKAQMFKNKPKHDWSSHGSDSFGYSALDNRTSRFEEERMLMGRLQTTANSEYNELG